MNENWTLDSTVLTFDKDVLLDTIVMKGGTFEPIYTDPYFLKSMSDSWWKKWQPTFDKWWIASEKEYEPLWDRNGYVEIHEDTTDDGFSNTETSGKEVMDDDTSKTSREVEVMNDDTTNATTIHDVVDNDTTSNETTTNSVSAYDAGNALTTHDASTTNGSGTSDTTTDTTSSSTGTDDRTTTTDYNESGTDDRTTTTTGKSDNTNGNDRDFDHARHEWGNWGISTTSQKLLQQEYETRYLLNTYELMADVFVRELCVRVF